ncbi:MAG: tetratricopeptide repeat protein [Verrucomicrobiaceae bacterium]|nr:tetratricopeptide repeat protein [Verrucomicrobiaceae bacterium]
MTLAVALYVPTLHHDKLLDDTSYVFENPLLETGKSFLYPIELTGFIRDAHQRGLQGDLAVNFILRPVGYATFFWNRIMHGQETAGYRIVNIAIHAVNALLLWLLASRLLAAQGLPGRWGASVAALLFAVHPVMTESVTYIAQRFESLATLFVLATTLMWITQRQASSAGRPPLYAVILSFGSVCFLLLAMLTKETGVVTPVLLILAAWLVLGNSPLKAVLSASGPLCCLPLVPALLAATTFIHHGDIFPSTVLNMTNHPSAPLTPLEYAVSELPVWAAYLGVLFWPVHLRFDPLVAPLVSIWEPQLWTAVLVCGGLVGGGWIAWRRRRNTGGGLVFFGILWFFISLLPSSSIVPLPDLYAEHRTYLPSVGLFLALAVMVEWCWQALRSPYSRWLLAGAVTACVGILSVATVQRNEQLRDEVALYRQIVAENPDHSRAWLVLSSALVHRSDKEGGLECLEKALECPHPSARVFINLGILLLNQNQVTRAHEITQQGLQRFPEDPKLLHNAGVAHYLADRTSEAEKCLLRTLELAPSHWPTALPLAHVYCRTQRPLDALHLLEQLARMQPLPAQEADLLAKLRRQHPGSS